VLFGGFVALTLSLVFGSMKASDAYRQAMDRARTSPAVVEALGTPIREGFFVSGNISVDGASGMANLAIPVSGPRGKGTVYVEAKKAVGEWTFSRLVFEAAETKERVDILEEKR
ncbi:MAG: hypothetical protein HY816_13875, partial [Candidatus Wallbacteria bacterium]|nr:hypothetical protein [Candidatus Wallbacteria bacterium]